ncbi:mobilization protein [Muricauda sp. JGD-17]|uniref:Mobilization protein n=1 Tax=Flagellimonas ochracea TaxID=2696472 RepID=A0A964TAT3_9FLAO|nr:MobB family relaxase [Allomuricauda ochracea]NAY91410.1 mobilization protein [Allomuricauda ochracea]
MYITVTRQHMDQTFSQSSADFVTYLEKENKGKSFDLQEHFFDQYNDRISPEQVIAEIDGNTAKLKKREPKFYSLTLNPSQRELKAINNDPTLLRRYVREAMKDYAASFYRKTPVSVDSIKYYAKIEHGRTFKGFDKKVKENQPYRAEIARLNNEIRKIHRGELQGSIKKRQKQIEKLIEQTLHKIDGVPIKQGMAKPGLQTHVHIIVSRKDVTNRFSLSPGSSYKESEAKLNGETVKRGFKRDQFFENAEKTFDKLFGYDRNFAEHYRNRKTFVRDPTTYFAQLTGLPVSERGLALKILNESGLNVPNLNIPANKVQLAVKTFHKLKRAMQVAQKSTSIEI